MKVTKILPLLILLIIMTTVYLTGFHEMISYESLKENRDTLKLYVSNHPYIAAAAYIFIYATSTALSIPGGAILSIFGGFLFPQPFSTLFVLVGATTGATSIFLIAQTAFGDSLKKNAGKRLQKMQTGFQNNAASYLLFLRLVPLFPFWLVNLAPAFFGVSLFTFIWTTFIGIIPGSFVYTQAGVGLDAIFETGETFSVDSLFNNQMKIALFALGIFSLFPIVIKKIKRT